MSEVSRGTVVVSGDRPTGFHDSLLIEPLPRCSMLSQEVFQASPETRRSVGDGRLPKGAARYFFSGSKNHQVFTELQGCADSARVIGERQNNDSKEPTKPETTREHSLPNLRHGFGNAGDGTLRNG